MNFGTLDDWALDLLKQKWPQLYHKMLGSGSIKVQFYLTSSCIKTSPVPKKGAVV